MNEEDIRAEMWESYQKIADKVIDFTFEDFLITNIKSLKELLKASFVCDCDCFTCAGKKTQGI